MWIYERAVTICNEGGRPLKLTGVSQDVTEQVQAEEALRESERKYSLLFEQAVDGIAVTDRERTIIDVNQSFAQLVGYDKSELIGRSAAELLHANENLVHQQSLSQIDNGEQVVLERRLIHRDGHVVIVEGSGTLLADGTRLAVVRDITERERVEREREEALALLDTLVRGVPVGFAFLDSNLRFRLVNDALAEINGVPAADHIGRTLEEVVPDVAPEVENLFRRVIETGEPIVNYEISGETAREPGVKRYWLESWYPVKGASGACLGAGAVVVEVTEMQRAQEEIADLNKRLHRAVYESSHRLKNHLQLLTAVSDMALMEGDENVVDAAQMRRLGISIRMMAQIHDVLTLETKGDAHAETIPAQTLLNKVASVLPRDPERHKVRVTADDMMIPVRFASTLALALNEMTSNSWKHGGVEVEIGLQAHGDNVTLHVCDDGPGFPSDFDPAKDANTGLELLTSLARYDLQGDVRFHNQTAGGGRVEIRFTLPTKGSGTT